MDSPDEDEDRADQARRRLRYTTLSIRSGNGKDTDDRVIRQDGLGRVGHCTQDSMTEWDRGRADVRWLRR